MPGIKELKNKIKSVKSTRKITKAMQMVSAAKMRKAQTAALSSRRYSDLAWELIERLTSSMNRTDEAGSDNIEQDEFATLSLVKNYPNASKTAVIVISTNKGLVGSFNTNLLSKLRELEAEKKTSDDLKIFELLVMGKKIKDASVRTGRNMVADFNKSDNWAPIENIYPIAKAVTDLYLTGKYKEVLIVYNHFVSTLNQKPTVKQLLPFRKNTATDQKVDKETDYLFEPSPKLVLNHLIPRIVESQIYQSVLESDASEHSARMVMMKNATEAAGDLIADYTLTYNQLRQGKITTELAEITAGKIALE